MNKIIQELLANTPRVVAQRTNQALHEAGPELPALTRTRLVEDLGRRALEVLCFSRTTRPDSLFERFSVTGYVIPAHHLEHMLQTAFEAGATGNYQRSESA